MSVIRSGLVPARPGSPIARTARQTVGLPLAAPRLEERDQEEEEEEEEQEEQQQQGRVHRLAWVGTLAIRCCPWSTG